MNSAVTRTAVFGGSFDPVHKGHIAIVRTILDKGFADRVLIIPAWRSPLKHLPAANLAHRFRMLEIAFTGAGCVAISDLEAWPAGESPMPGKPVRMAPCSYTVDTLRCLAGQDTSGKSELSIVVGEDSLTTLDKWKGRKEIESLSRFIVVPRPEAFSGIGVGSNFSILEMEPVGVSSTSVRTMTSHEDLAEATCPGVVAYIVGNSLYSFSDPRMEDLSVSALELSRSLTGEARGIHCMGTGIEAERLAIMYGADPVKARIAGFLHDAARDMPLNEVEALLDSMRHSGDRWFEATASDPWPISVAHGPAAAMLAVKRLGIRDSDILEGIAYHAVGKGGMGPVAACVYVADLIEPTRNYPGLWELRELAGLSSGSGNLAVLLTAVANCKIGHLEAFGHKVLGTRWKPSTGVPMSLPKVNDSAIGRIRLNFKALKIIMLVAAVLILWCAGVLYFNDESPIKGPSKDRYVLMLLGTDVMFGINRSDTIVIGFVDAVRKKVNVISIPRDTKVDIPGIGVRKINAAFALGSLKKFGGNGVAKAIEVVQSLLGVTIDYFAKVDLAGFINIIDALEGIDVDVETDMQYEDKQGGLKIDIKKGRQLLSGQKSMEYVRYREKIRGDLGRIERQQKFINAVVGKLKSPGIIFKIPAIARIVHDNLTTNMRLMTMLTLGEMFKDFERGRDFSFHTLPGEAKYIDGKSYFIADMEKHQELSRSFFWDGSPARVVQQPAKYPASVLSGEPTCSFLIPTAVSTASPAGETESSVDKSGRSAEDVPGVF